MHFLSPLFDFCRCPTKRSLITLLLGVIPLLFALCYLSYTGLTAGSERLLWLRLLPGALDSVAISLLLLLGGAFLLDYSEKADRT